MKVLFYAPLAVLSYHHETDLELIKNHLDKGDEVKVIVCDGGLKDAGYSGCAGMARCRFCISRREDGLQALGLSANQIIEIKPMQNHKVPDYFSDLSALKAFEYDGADVGMAVASTLISHLRESNPNIKKFSGYIQRSLKKTIGIYQWFDDYFLSEKPDLLYFFNGRFTLFRPVMRAAQKHGIHFFIHERSGCLHRYSLTESTYPHDLRYKKNEILESVVGANPDEVVRVASEWYNRRASKKDDAWYSFTKSQRAGCIPKKMMGQLRTVAVFVSSQDEFEAIVGWDNPLFKNQTEAIRFILDSFLKDKSFHFFIRIHPNLEGLRNSQTRSLMELKQYENATIISAEENVDTYELMMKSEKILTFGSTMGMEAVFHGKPSILVGRSFYESLVGPYVPRDKSELLKLIAANLSVQPKDGALNYGYWLATYGHVFKYFQPTGLSRGLFLGREIEGSRLWRIISYFTFGVLQLKQVLSGELAFKVVKEKVKAKLLRPN